MAAPTRGRRVFHFRFSEKVSHTVIRGRLPFSLVADLKEVVPERTYTGAAGR
jgi:hypothetical protein